MVDEGGHWTKISYNKGTWTETMVNIGAAWLLHVYFVACRNVKQWNLVALIMSRRLILQLIELWPLAYPFIWAKQPTTFKPTNSKIYCSSCQLMNTSLNWLIQLYILTGLYTSLPISAHQRDFLIPGLWHLNQILNCPKLHENPLKKEYIV